MSEPTPEGLQIPFEAGREAEIWQEVLSRLSDMTKTNAKNVSRTAISGPNSLVLYFPKSYDLSRQYLERSAEHVSRIEKTLAQVVGQPIRVQLSADTEAPVTRAAPEPVPVVVQAKAPDSERDAFVQKAIAVFGATVVKSEACAAPAKVQEP